MPTRISSGDRHLGDLVEAAGEADRGQQGEELAAVRSCHALTTGRRLQSLRRAEHPDDHDVGPGLLGSALSQRVAGHWTASLDFSTGLEL
jgi:hypothetical protein